MGFGILLDIFIYISAFYSLDLLDLRQTLDFNPHHDIELTAAIFLRPMWAVKMAAVRLNIRMRVKVSKVLR